VLKAIINGHIGDYGPHNYYSVIVLQRNFGIKNLKGPKIMFFIAGVLLLHGLFTIKLTTEGLKINFFIAEILLLKGPSYRGFSVHKYF
jgi:hypothetical protein